MSLRAALHRELDPKARRKPGLSPTNWFVVGLIILSTLVVILETEPVLQESHARTFRLIDLALASIFAVEYAARLWCAGEDPRYRGLTGRLRYATTPMALIDLLALASLAAPLVEGNGVLVRILRLLRILRLARLARFTAAGAALGEAIRARSYELAVSASAAAALLLVSSTLLYVAESEAQPEAFGSIPRAMWWSVATLTTVGYGDVFPVTPLGRILASVTAVLGIGLIAMPTGILAAAFSDTIQRERAASQAGLERAERDLP